MRLRRGLGRKRLLLVRRYARAMDKPMSARFATSINASTWRDALERRPA